MDINTNTGGYNPALSDTNKTSSTVASNSRENHAAAQNAAEFTAQSKTAANLSAPNAPTASPFAAILQSLTTLLNQLTSAAPKQVSASQANASAPANYADSLNGLQASNMTVGEVLSAEAESARSDLQGLIPPLRPSTAEGFVPGQINVGSDPGAMSQGLLNSNLSSMYDTLNATTASGAPTAAAASLREGLLELAGLEEVPVAEAQAQENARRDAAVELALTTGQPTPPPAQTITSAMRLGSGGEISQEQLQAAMILASADDNFHLIIDGNVNISSTVRTFPTNDLSVNAEDATFISTPRADVVPPTTNGVDGDLISIEARQNTAQGPDNEDIDITWHGGAFDISNSLTADADSPLIGQFGPSQAGVLVEQARRDDIAGRRGTAATSDGLSIRGTNNNEVQHLKTAEVSNVRVVGVPVNDLNADFDNLTAAQTVLEIDPDPSVPPGTLIEVENTNRQFWPNAGGDSGIFVQGVNQADINNNELFGIRDAGIYVTASGIEENDDPNTTTNFGSNYTLTGNKVKNSFDGISSKRGVDNLLISQNEIEDVVTALSTKKTLDDPDNDASKSNFVSITDNEIRGATRGILLEAANVVSVTDNNISDIGQLTGGLRFGQNSSERGTFEGIVLEGVTSTASADAPSNALGISHEVINNEISVTTDADQLAALSTLDGVVSRFIAIAQRDFFQTITNDEGERVRVVQTEGQFLPVSADPSSPTGNTINNFGTGRVIAGGQDAPDPRSDLTGSAAPRVNRVSFAPTENLAPLTSREE